MAQRVITQLIDDIDGKEITAGKGETVSFALDGASYEIDLSTKNADAFRALLQDHISVARKVGRKTGTTGKRSQSGTSPAEIRDWARSNGFEVPDRGRIPAEVRESFESKR
ncbi:histone-like nucleoid-structuring protein Lsr2 [Nocardioides lijunqiniae]|uniref:histone-like nucleoid-structuring protein Lsr2 n=1 Tax=Nocardioides lijunqiniae TaxID=2760832 RepID=UPI001877DFC6|nr:Lsr2 family protein [Nocardioides lijunqiniae]